MRIHLTLVALFLGACHCLAAPAAVPLRWLDGGAPATAVPAALGIPWPQGSLPAGAPISVKDARGHEVPAQTWTLAIWPDGSVKWSAIAVSAGPASGELTVHPGQAGTMSAGGLSVETLPDGWRVRTSAYECVVPHGGRDILASLRVGGRLVGQHGRLVGMLESTTEQGGERLSRESDFTGVVDAVAVEQSGPVRAVFRLSGRHRSLGGGGWLPFVLRLYFTEGTDAIRLVHSIVYAGVPDGSRIRGLGVEFAVPLADEIQNRHVRLAGDSGLFSEAVRQIPGFRATLVKGAAEATTEQLAGRRAPALDSLDEKTRSQWEAMPTWDAFRLTQLSPDSFAIEKRTGPHSSWVQAHRGRHSLGTAYVGGVSGGLALGLRRFWEKHPTALEISGAGSDTATLRAWLWSPEAAAMDLRHYDDKGHALEIAYEDYEPGFSTPEGIANTSELTLWTLGATPSAEALLARAQTAARPPVLVCTPEHYASAQVFGAWSLPDRTHPLGEKLELALEAAERFQREEIARRGWYGFWNYGDGMRTYDGARHQWQYDVGGHAWNNAELNPDTWFWYAFLRSGRAESFRLAEDTTRHTSEVDVHHLGRFAGLGSRHNVSHWGCGAKEPRISMAGLKRFHYYLTTDERTGELIREALQADLRTVEINPLRKVMPLPEPGDGLVRSGPDWIAFASNWLAEWERTGDPRWRDYIRAGFDDFAATPDYFLKNLVYAYDVRTKRLRPVEGKNIPMGHFIVIFGGDQMIEELLTVVPHPAFERLWARLQSQWAETPRAAGYSRSRAAAHVARATKAPEDVRRAWNSLASTLAPGTSISTLLRATPLDGPGLPSPVVDVPGVYLPFTAQWAHEVIQSTAFLKGLPPPQP